MQTALMIIQIIPALLKIIAAVEEMFPQPNMGTAKLQLVKELLSEIYESVGVIWPTIEKIVEIVVKFANKTGVFIKGEPK